MPSHRYRILFRQRTGLVFLLLFFQAVQMISFYLVPQKVPSGPSSSPPSRTCVSSAEITVPCTLCLAAPPGDLVQTRSEAMFLCGIMHIFFSTKLLEEQIIAGLGIWTFGLLDLDLDICFFWFWIYPITKLLQIRPSIIHSPTHPVAHPPAFTFSMMHSARRKTMGALPPCPVAVGAESRRREGHRRG